MRKPDFIHAGLVRPWVVASALLISLTVACVASAAPGSASSGSTLTIADPLGCNSINPDDATSVSLFFREMVYEAPIKAHKVGTGPYTFSPGLAVSWRIFPGNKTFQFTFRHNARFSDGTLVTTSAVKAWFDFIAKATTGYNTLGPIASIVVLNKWSIRVKLETANPNILTAIAFSNWGMIASPKVLPAALANPQSSPLATKTYGAGPYVLDPTQSILKDHCTFVPNKFYYDRSRIHWKKIVIKEVADPNAILAGLESGQFDIGVGSSETASAAASAGLNVLVGPGAGVGGGMTGLMFLDHSGAVTPALGNVKVRQALNYAINRQAIVRAFYGKYATPISIPNYGWDGVDPKYVHYYSYDPNKAKALLAAAGYPRGFTFTIVAAGCSAVPYEHVCQALVQDLGAVGVTAKLDLDPSYTGFIKKTESAFFVALGALNMGIWYQFVLKPGGAIADQHGWYDRVSNNLYYEYLRLPAAQSERVAEQISDRATTQAYCLPILSESYVVYESKRVTGATADRYTIDTSTIIPKK